MRLAVTSAAKGNMEICKSIRQFLSGIHNGTLALCFLPPPRLLIIYSISAFSYLGTTVEMKDLPSKIEVMAQSLAKVDQVCFKVTVRKGEFPDEDIKFVEDGDGGE